jgi:hypothetical protein
VGRHSSASASRLLDLDGFEVLAAEVVTNPKRGLSEAQLQELLQDTFAQYTAIAGAATVQPEASVAFRSWRAYLALACDPTLNIKELLAKEGLQVQS